jgi:hypothetical protein
VSNTPTKEKRGRGRPAHKPTAATRRKVEELAGYGLSQDNVASIMDMHDTTLRKHYADELKRGRAKSNAGVGRTLYQKAMGGDTTAMIWWTKVQMRWSGPKDGERMDQEEAGPVRKVVVEIVDGT